jgi:hypothetical protein
MKEVADLIADMVRAGIDPEIIGRTAAALSAREPVLVPDEQAERRRAADRERKRLRKSAESAESAEVVSPKKEIPPTPPKEKNTPSNSVSVGAREFDQFWSLFPNKVGKRDAERAFVNARSRAPLDAILDGLRRYAAKTDDRPWCNPATFLNQNRWEDQPATAPPRQHSTAPPPVSNFNAILDDLQGKTHASHPGPSIDASVNRADSGGASNLVQLNALSARR